MSYSFACKGSEVKTLRRKSPLFGKYIYTRGQLRLPNLVRLPSPMVAHSLLFDLILSHRPFKAAYFSLRLVPSLGYQLAAWCNVQVQRCRERKLFSAGQMASIDLPVTDRLTDKSKISIMISQLPGNRSNLSSSAH